MIKAWKYKSKEVKEIPEEYIGFVYLITNKENGWIYVGKKFANFTRKKALTKKEKLLPENKRKKFKMVVSGSGWEDYWGSSETLVEDVKKYGKENFKREIICFCTDKRELTYREVWWQFKYNVLEVPSYNFSILGRFFKKKDNG